MRVEERFLRYAGINTQSAADQEQIPSTACQWDLARLLVQELKELGVEDARVDEHCYVMGTIPSNLPEGSKAPALGLIAHMDTATETSGKGVKPRIIKNYDGKAIVLNEERNMVLSPDVFGCLNEVVGLDLIVTDGTTLLGGDDKAGIAEIMTAVEYFQTHPEAPHGKLCIGFTPDEEVGRGADRFDVKAFGADVAYTLDGGALGELEYENFNAASARIEITGTVVHPGSAKDKMVNAAVLAAEFHGKLPQQEAPAHTEGYEGFYHLQRIEGSVDKAELEYIIRDHDQEIFAARKKRMQEITDEMNKTYGADTVRLQLRDSYYNMKEQILPHMELIDLAKEAMQEEGITPIVIPIRGGTDGARLSYMGLPCPNLCAGGYYAHGPFEFVPIQSMERISNLLIRLVGKFAER